uniref:NADH dehydrogenase subunit 6 n=1 Tax=Leucoptera coffeella TaxID=1178041 RepID=UPI002E76863F|nr:NADH dehydrogenase subunit 6 [Leucoptera coffeella]WPR14281.1 NADH dehydrogenase subunit 6 [Leucoptera coffeella]
MKIILMGLIINLSFLMYFLNHPLTMGFMIIVQTLLTCLMSGLLLNTYWFSYILFLTFLGGMLVLFIYVSSIASNELFYNSKYLLMMLIMNFFLLFLMYIIFYNKEMEIKNINNEMNKLNYEFFMFNYEYKINISKMYNNQSPFMMYMLIIYLFITLIAVVKINNIFYGPLRSSNF